ncbi:hypothetical protein BU204_36730 [Actinophytocola xanthii]|uniref:Uncharacterized protein n=2 Tax=Actinophytocola xanthii TaxID=1912961 RepID=A0A1Q8BV61_9PSEU|nr:hypothetical protein BU204_36730 [Actinophytocola xanthii]
MVSEQPTAAQPTVARSSQPAPVGVRGCRIEPCAVLASAAVAGTSVELLADAGARSGRLRIGGPSSGTVIETTVTDLGVTLTRSSLTCLARALSACLVLGEYQGGTAGQVVVGRSGHWSSLAKPFVSDAGYLALAEVTGRLSGPEVVAVQHECDRTADSGCADAPVFAQVFATTGVEVQCTRRYPSLEAMPGYPSVTLADPDLSPC